MGWSRDAAMLRCPRARRAPGHTALSPGSLGSGALRPTRDSRGVPRGWNVGRGTGTPLPRARGAAARASPPLSLSPPRAALRGAKVKAGAAPAPPPRVCACVHMHGPVPPLPAAPRSPELFGHGVIHLQHFAVQLRFTCGENALSTSPPPRVAPGRSLSTGTPRCIFPILGSSPPPRGTRPHGAAPPPLRPRPPRRAAPPLPPLRPPPAPRPRRVGAAHLVKWCPGPGGCRGGGRLRAPPFSRPSIKSEKKISEKFVGAGETGRGGAGWRGAALGGTQSPHGERGARGEPRGAAHPRGSRWRGWPSSGPGNPRRRSRT